MTNQIILQKAIEKAVKNGYQFDTLYWTQSMLKEGASEHIIFSHDFAEAFWGEKPKGMEEQYEGYWKDQLQIMVLEKDPLQYLEKFL